MLNKIEAFIFDMDGVFYKGDKKLPGGSKIINHLKTKGIPFVFLTNNSRKTPNDYILKLSKLGINIEIEHIITSGTLAKEYIDLYFKDEKIKIYGSDALKELFISEQIAYDEDFNVVLIGMEGSLTLDNISSIRTYANMGKQLIFTNPDRLIPIENGFNFECGAIIKLIEKYCKKEPIIMGKPSNFSFEYAIKKLNKNKQNIAMIGDTYDTDIQGAIDIGIVPIHLQTSSNYSYNTNNLEAYEFNNLEDLLKQI
jgi:HAD superfamily hydrolase (TIGR01450 family)